MIPGNKPKKALFVRFLTGLLIAGQIAWGLPHGFADELRAPQEVETQRTGLEERLSGQASTTADPLPAPTILAEPLPSQPTYRILVPAYNEERQMDEVLQEIKRRGYLSKTIVIDDGSQDRTPEILKRWQQTEGLRIFISPVNGRVVGAYQYALDQLLKEDGALPDYVILVDADSFLEKSPQHASIDEAVQTSLAQMKNYKVVAAGLPVEPWIKPNSNWIEKVQITTYRATYLIRRLMAGRRQQIVISGAGGIFEGKLLHQTLPLIMRGRDLFQDLHITWVLQKQGYPIGYVERDLTVKTDVPKSVAGLIKQRTRWIRVFLRVSLRERLFLAGQFIRARWVGLVAALELVTLSTTAFGTGLFAVYILPTDPTGALKDLFISSVIGTSVMSGLALLGARNAEERKEILAVIPLIPPYLIISTMIPSALGFLSLFRWFLPGRYGLPPVEKSPPLQEPKTQRQEVFSGLEEVIREKGAGLEEDVQALVDRMAADPHQSGRVLRLQAHAAGDAAAALSFVDAVLARGLDPKRIRIFKEAAPPDRALFLERLRKEQALHSSFQISPIASPARALTRRIALHYRQGGAAPLDLNRVAPEHLYLLEAIYDRLSPGWQRDWGRPRDEAPTEVYNSIVSRGLKQRGIEQEWEHSRLSSWVLAQIQHEWSAISRKILLKEGFSRDYFQAMQYFLDFLTRETQDRNFHIAKQGEALPIAEGETGLLWIWLFGGDHDGIQDFLKPNDGPPVVSRGNQADQERVASDILLRQRIVTGRVGEPLNEQEQQLAQKIFISMRIHNLIPERVANEAGDSALAVLETTLTPGLAGDAVNALRAAARSNMPPAAQKFFLYGWLHDHGLIPDALKQLVPNSFQEMRAADWKQNSQRWQGGLEERIGLRLGPGNAVDFVPENAQQRVVPGREVVFQAEPPTVLPGIYPGDAGMEADLQQLRKMILDGYQTVSGAGGQFNVEPIVRWAQDRIHPGFQPRTRGVATPVQFEDFLDDLLWDLFLPAGEIARPFRQDGVVDNPRFKLLEPLKEEPYLTGPASTRIWAAQAQRVEGSVDLAGSAYSDVAVYDREISGQRRLRFHDSVLESTRGIAEVKELLRRIRQEDEPGYLRLMQVQTEDEERRHAQDYAWTFRFFGRTLRKHPARKILVAEALVKPGSLLDRSYWTPTKLSRDVGKMQNAGYAIAELAGQAGSRLKRMEIFLREGKDDWAYALFWMFLLEKIDEFSRTQKTEPLSQAEAYKKFVAQAVLSYTGRSGYNNPQTLADYFSLGSTASGAASRGKMAYEFLLAFYGENFLTDPEREQLFTASGLEEEPIQSATVDQRYPVYVVADPLFSLVERGQPTNAVALSKLSADHPFQRALDENLGVLIRRARLAIAGMSDLPGARALSRVVTQGDVILFKASWILRNADQRELIRSTLWEEKLHLAVDRLPVADWVALNKAIMESDHPMVRQLREEVASIYASRPGNVAHPYNTAAETLTLFLTHASIGLSRVFIEQAVPQKLWDQVLRFQEESRPSDREVDGVIVEAERVRPWIIGESYAERLRKTSGGLEERAFAERWDGLRSAALELHTVVIGRSVVEQVPQIRLLTGLEERLVMDDGADTVIQLAERGVDSVRYYGGLEEIERFAAYAHGMLAIDGRSLTERNNRIQLAQILSLLGIPVGAIERQLDELAAGLEELAVGA